MVDNISEKYWKCFTKNNKDYLKYSEFLDHIDNFGMDINDIYLENIIEC